MIGRRSPSARRSRRLLVCDADAGRLIIADGYHRLCAAYSIHGDVLIPSKNV